MFALSPALDISWVPRRPRNASQLEVEGWRFLTLRRDWDAAEKEDLLAATGLSAISCSYAEHLPRGWWVAFLRGYLASRDPVQAAARASIES